MPGQYFYFDMRQSPHEDGHDWAAIFDVRKTYSFDFARCGFTPAQEANVLGVEGAFFSELYVSHNPETPDYLDYMTFPRACAWPNWVGARGCASGRSFTAVCGRTTIAWGRRASLPPDAAPCELQGRSVDRCCRRRFANLTFTVDGAQPRPYTGPIRMERPELYLFRSSYRSGRSPEVGAPAYYRTLKPAVKITTSMGESKQFPLRTCRGGTAVSPARRALAGRATGSVTISPSRSRAANWRCVRATCNCPVSSSRRDTSESSTDGETFERVGGVGERRADDPPAVEADPCDPRRLDLRSNGCPFVTVQSPVVK